MSRHDYQRLPEEIDMAEEERAIRRNSTLAFILVAFGYLGAYRILPELVILPTELSERLAFAAICWAIPGLVLLVAIMMVSTARRFSPEDIGGQAAGPPSERLAIKAAFLQNTLEQTVVAGGFYFALAALAGGAWLALLPVGSLFFVVGRVLFYRGYKGGAKGRALGMALTMLPTFVGYLILLFLVFR